MDFLMTPDAERDEVLLGIVTQSAPGVDVVDLEAGKTPAVLAAPAIPLQHLVAELAVRVRVEAKPGAGPP